MITVEYPEEHFQLTIYGNSIYHYSHVHTNGIAELLHECEAKRNIGWHYCYHCRKSFHIDFLEAYFMLHPNKVYHGNIQ